MPRFHFNVEDGRHYPDQDGLELAGQAAARDEALRAIGELVAAKPEDFWRDGFFRMTVTDDDGLTLFILDLSAVISPAAQSH
jgi:hypothetical protein